ncbi:hypothetical protein [Bacillus mycoides]|uniref:hypothetical protein n=1 Tax=Bacillus mycoides TaxID=1405 RepID=UPI0013FD2ABA|nr:hypothetical protein [Bacillus mycoides]
MPRMKGETTGDSSRWSWIEFKAEVARSESQGVGAFTSEALFASNVKAKRPKILATGAG